MNTWLQDRNNAKAWRESSFYSRFLFNIVQFLIRRNRKTREFVLRASQWTLDREGRFSSDLIKAGKKEKQAHENLK